MLFTYLWRIAFVGAAIETTSLQDINIMADVVNWILLFNYVILIFIANSRGKIIEKRYLVAFPVIGGFFDILLVFIPMIPTVMNILALVIGLSDSSPKVIYVQTPTETNQSKKA